MDNSILKQVGNTPLIFLEKTSQELSVQLYGKLEMFNPGGSIKDRPALLMLTKALETGRLEKGGTVVESSSGNMAIGLAQACRYLDLKLVVVVDPKINGHTLKVLQAYGAQIEQVDQADSDGNYLNTRLQRVQQLLDRIPGSFWPNQYASEYNPAAHYQTMDEIVLALPSPPDYLLAATSTCGTIMGCANYVRQHNLNTQIVAVDAVGSVIFGTQSANRLVPGHGAGRPSDLLDKEAVDHVIHITDQECVIGCRMLFSQEAILAGGSSGAVIMAAKKIQPGLPDGSTLALILPDSGERYLDTIYNDQWIQEHFGTIEEGQTVVQEAPKAFSTTGSVNGSTDKPTDKAGNQDIRRVAIIGGGPKGTYGFERLAAQFKAHPPSQRVEIHVYNCSAHFGAGDIYRPNQPSYLIINNPVGDINMWTDEAPAAVVKDPLSATTWLKQEKGNAVGPRDYVPRAAVGEYLQEGFQAISSALPPRVSGSYIVGKVTDIQKCHGQYALTVISPTGNTGNIPHQYDHILLATGHPKNNPASQNSHFLEFSEDNKAVNFIPFIYPVDTTLSRIEASQKVAIKGLGLTFIDATLALTEGRGGTFDRHSSGELSYQRSGYEPQVLYPFSRRGWPMIPRIPPPNTKQGLTFFTYKALEEIKQQQPEGKLTFRDHIWPLLKQEMLLAFYSQEIINEGFKDDLFSCTTFPEVQHYIERYHRQHPRKERFHPESFLEPWQKEAFREAQSFTSYIQSYLNFYIEEAQKGEEKSPWAAVTGVWRKATPIFAEYYQFGGLSPAAQAYFDHTFRPLLNRVTFGPPVKNAEKMVALIRSGLLNFGFARNPAIQTDEQKKQFILAASNAHYTAEVDAVIDARIPKVSISESQGSLYNKMLDRGLISLHRNTTRQHSYAPGCVAMTPDGFIIDGYGEVNKDLAVTGTPTEGITFDNDTLSRTRNNVVGAWAAYVRKSCAQPTVENHGS